MRTVHAGDVIGEYVLLERIGEGGFGAVWRAENPALPGKIVAIKFPGSERAARSLRVEAVAQHRLQHPRIVRTLSLNLQHAPPYVVFEFIDGQSLRDRLRVGGSLTKRELRVIGGDILEACTFAHAEGIVHGDLSPSNVLIDREGRAHVTDFGLSLDLASVADSISVSRSNTVASTSGPLQGTAAYVAPELRAGGRKTPGSDVYALGVMFVEMATGDAGYLRFPVLELSVSESAVLEKATARRPQERFNNAGQMLDALTAATSAEQDLSYPAKRPNQEQPLPAQPRISATSARRSLTPGARRCVVAGALLLLAVPLTCLGVSGRSGHNNPQSWAELATHDALLQANPGVQNLPPVPRSWDKIVDMEEYRRLLAVNSGSGTTNADSQPDRLDQLLDEARAETVRELRLNMTTSVPDDWGAVLDLLRIRWGAIQSPRDELMKELQAVSEANASLRRSAFERLIVTRRAFLIRSYVVCAWRPLHRGRLAENYSYGASARHKIWVEVTNCGYTTVELEPLMFHLESVNEIAPNSGVQGGLTTFPRVALKTGGATRGVVGFDLPAWPDEQLILKLYCKARSGSSEVEPNVLYLPALNTELDLQVIPAGRSMIELLDSSAK